MRDSILSCVVEIVEDGGAGEAASTGPSVVSFPPPPEEKSYPSQPIGMYFLYLDLFTQTHESINMVTPLTATP